MTVDFGVAKGLSHLPELKEIGFTASRRLLDVQRISHDPAEGAAVLAALTQPAISPAGTRTAGMPLISLRVQALLSALCVFRLLPHGFTNRDLRTCLAPLLGLEPGAMTCGQNRIDWHRKTARLADRLTGTVPPPPGPPRRRFPVACVPVPGGQQWRAFHSRTRPGE